MNEIGENPTAQESVAGLNTSENKFLKDLYDIIVIGAGSGGLSVGLSMHRLGFSVLMIDKNDHAIGGECLNTGCVPSKALIHISRIAHAAKKAQDYGKNVDGKVDFGKVKQYIEEKKQIIRQHENADYFKNQGIDIALGTARFVSDDSVEVGKKIYKGRKIVIATGSKPRKLQIPGAEMVEYYDNENIFNIGVLPERLLLIGGGPIGIELGQAFHRLGSKVTIVHEGEMILSKEDPEIANILIDQLQKEGIVFHLNTKPKEFTSPREVKLEHKDRKETVIPFDAVLTGIGREVDFQLLQLENAGIEVENGKIKVNHFLQTTNKRVYLSGDVAGNVFFSHGAELHATLLLNNFFSPIRKKLSFENFPWVTFTDPEVAAFGMNEQQLKEKGIKYERHALEFDEDDRAVVGDYRYGKLILFLEKRWYPGNSKILGGSMIAPHAGEIIQELVLANAAGIKSSAIFNKIYAYPTSSRVNKTLMINRYNNFLTPFIKKLLHLVYKLK